MARSIAAASTRRERELPDTMVCDAVDVCRTTVKRVRARFVEGGIDAVLTDKVQARRRQVLTGEPRAHLIAIACSPVPEGYDH